MKKIDWQQSLLEEFKAASGRPFVWGESDCCLFAADCVMAQSGIDPAASYRGSYDSALGARKALLRQHGDIEAAFAAVLQEVTPALVQRGDVVTFDGPLGVTAGIYWAGSIWAMSESGLIQLTAPIRRSWRAVCRQS